MNPQRKAAPAADSREMPEGRGRQPAPSSNAPRVSPEEVYRRIQESAYLKASARGFAPGGEIQDWIEAEAEVRRQLGAHAPD